MFLNNNTSKLKEGEHIIIDGEGLIFSNPNFKFIASELEQISKEMKEEENLADNRKPHKLKFASSL